MAIRYIGSKARLTDQIIDIVKASSSASSRFVDVFGGTGVVASRAADEGFSVVVNDMLASSSLISEAKLISKKQASFSSFGSIEAALVHLNSVPPRDGYIYRTYSPASAEYCEHERKYFTKENAAKIDAVRAEIQRLFESGQINRIEMTVLLASLLAAANHVANTAGTYGCFLRRWTPNAMKPMMLEPLSLREEEVDYKIITGDVFDVATEWADSVYLDPPYTKRQYASYYHIAETISLGDEPFVQGVAGLRPWKDKASPFCYKTKALGALMRCACELNSKNLFFSYSNQGHVALDEFVAGLEQFGAVEVRSLGEIGRYRPNKTASKAGSQVEEYLICLSKSDEFRRGTN